MAGKGMRDIKRRVRSVNSIKQITKAMELVSSAKLRRARERVERAKDYFETVRETMQDILADIPPTVKHRYLEEREKKNSCYIVLTADRGLCGGYNANIIRLAVEDMQQKSGVSVITVGQKARDYFKKRNYHILEEYTGISETPTYFDAKQIAKKVLDLYEKQEIDEVYLVYTQFISTITQKPELFRLLPIEKNEEKPVEKQSGEVFEYTDYQPSPESLLEYLIPKYVESVVYGALIEASASEQGARRVAMENATDNAEEMIDELTLSYNRARQAAITQEIAEIVGGAEALK